MIDNILTTSIIIGVTVLITRIIASIIKNNGIMDSIRGVGFLIIATFWYGNNRDPSIWQTILYILIMIRSISLTTYITWRNNGKPEDFRYKKRREERGKVVIRRSLIQIYLLQWVIMLVISLPIIYGLNNNIGIRQIIIWTTISAIGYYREAQWNRELITFKKDKKNKWKLLTTWLRKHSRHPNYFGEACIWRGIRIFALPARRTIASPILLTYLLRYVSWVTMLEKKYEGRKNFKQYKKTTPAFLPKIK